MNKTVPNRWQVLDELLAQQDWCSRRDLVIGTGLSEQSVSYALRDLIRGHLVETDTDIRALPGKGSNIQVRGINVYRAIIRRIK